MHRLADRSLSLRAATLLIALLALPAHAQPDGDDPSAGLDAPAPERRDWQQQPRRFPPGLAEARLVKERAEVLGVGEETLKKLDVMVTEVRAKEAQLRAKLLEATQKVDVLLEEARPDESAVLEASAVASGISRETRELRLRFSLQVRGLLSEKQLGKFMEIRTKAVGAKRRRGQRPRR